MPHSLLVKRLCTFLFFLVATFSYAAEYTWTGAAHNGVFNNPGNWLDGHTPASNDPDAIIILSEQGAGTVTLTNPLTVRINKLVFENNTAAYTLNGNGSHFQCAEGITQTGTGALILNNLTLEATNNQLFFINGTATFNCQIQTSETQTIIKAGTGTVEIAATQTGFSGTLNMIAGTTLLSANPGGSGQFGIYAGTLTIAPGLNITNRINLHSAPGTPNNINIAGNTTISGELALNGDTTLNVNGPGRLNITGPVIAGTITPESRLVLTGNGLAVLSGSNSFVGNIRVETGNVILNSAGAMPANSKVKLVGAGYAGYTENFAPSFSEFLASIRAITDPNAIVGIDSANPALIRVAPDDINLSIIDGFEQRSSFYLGTSSTVTLTGNITPTLLPSSAGLQSYDALYLTAIHGGYLNVASALGPNSISTNVNSVVIGQPASVRNDTGTVELSGNNSYSGGTIVHGGTLYVNGYNNLGSGVIVINNGATFNTGPSATVGNQIWFEPGSTFIANGTFTSRITLPNNVNFFPGGIGKIAEIHMHAGINFEPGAIWNVDLGANGSADKLCTWETLIITGNEDKPIIINLYSVNASGFGAITAFDQSQSYLWTIAYRPSTPFQIVGFDPAFFAVNAANFNQWNPNQGTFSIEQIGESLAIRFTPVPEPGTYALMLFGLGALAILEIRRRKKK